MDDLKPTNDSLSKHIFNQEKSALSETSSNRYLLINNPIEFMYELANTISRSVEFLTSISIQPDHTEIGGLALLQVKLADIITAGKREGRNVGLELVTVFEEWRLKREWIRWIKVEGRFMGGE